MMKKTNSNENGSEVRVEQTPDVSIVLACYNEEGHLQHSYEQIKSTIDNTVYSCELIFVDDCSEDKTREIIERIVESDPAASCIYHETNRGRGAAVKTGFEKARAPIAGFLDVDLEVHCRYIPAMIQAIENGADVAAGFRVYRIPFRLDDIIRDIMSVVYRFLVRRALGLESRDSESGYKFFSMETMRDLIGRTENEGWFWDTEIMAMAQYRGRRLEEIPVLYIRRGDKKTTVRPFIDSVEYLRRLLDFRKRCSQGIIYRSPRLYRTAMKLLYGREYDNRYESIHELIPAGASVLDVCCGDAWLYRRYLSQKNVRYTGIDISAAFIAAGAADGIDIRLVDIETDAMPEEADYVVIQGSLYQFIPSEAEILQKLAAAARKKLIVAEPVSNLAQSGNSMMKWISAVATNPGTGQKTERFTRERLYQLMQRFDVIESREICGGREMLYVIDTSGARTESS